MGVEPEATLVRVESAPSLTMGRPGTTGQLVPSCYRSHRAIAALLKNDRTNSSAADRLFEKRNPNELHDNVAQWYPLEQRPKWVTMRAYQRRQMRPWAERGKLPGGGLGAPRTGDEVLSMTAHDQLIRAKITDQLAKPVAGSKVGSGAFPHSFDFSAGKTMADTFYSVPTPARPAAIASFRYRR